MVAFVLAAAPHVKCVVVASPASAASAASALAGVEVLSVEMDDCWVRDTGPVFCLQRGAVVAVCFDFNGWGGGVYDRVASDRLVGGAIAAHAGVGLREGGIVLEGGSVSSDGTDVVTTEECLLFGRRNDGMTRERAEDVIRARLGARRVLWLENGAVGDEETNGHVDNMCVFIARGHVVLLWADAGESGDSEQHRRSAAAERVLLEEGICVHRVHATESVVRTTEEAQGVEKGKGAKQRPAGERLAASYVNFVFADDVIFVPRFGVEGADERALEEIREAVRIAAVDTGGVARKVIGVDAREFVLAGGGMHCLTLGVPAGGHTVK